MLTEEKCEGEGATDLAKFASNLQAPDHITGKNTVTSSSRRTMLACFLGVRL